MVRYSKHMLHVNVSPNPQILADYAPKCPQMPPGRKTTCHFRKPEEIAEDVLDGSLDVGPSIHPPLDCGNCFWPPD